MHSISTASFLLGIVILLCTNNPVSIYDRSLLALYSLHAAWVVISFFCRARGDFFLNAFTIKLRHSRSDNRVVQQHSYINLFPLSFSPDENWRFPLPLPAQYKWQLIMCDVFLRKHPLPMETLRHRLLLSSTKIRSGIFWKTTWFWYLRPAQESSFSKFSNWSRIGSICYVSSKNSALIFSTTAWSVLFKLRSIIHWPLF